MLQTLLILQMQESLKSIKVNEKEYHSHEYLLDSQN